MAEVLWVAIAKGYELSDEEQNAISDERISFEEYKQAVTRFRECMEANGTPIENFRYDEKTRQYDWTVWEEYFDNPGAKACEAELAPFDMQWQDQVEDELAPVREERRVKIIECMRAKGASVDPDLPYPALIVRAVREFPACVEAAFREVAASE